MLANFVFALMAVPLLGAEVENVADRPNFVLVMCDDMDLMLGGVNATPQVKHLLGDGGATASNYFVSSPKCTPSRSAWLSGRHYHNLRPHGKKTGKGLNTSNFFDEDAVFPTLRKAGYQTGIFGKIHNNQASWLCKPNNHSEPFDHIETECSPCGGYYRTGKNDWVKKETHDAVHEFETLDPASPWSNYSEAQYGNRTVAWIKSLVKSKKLPFFAFIGTSGPHLGVVPAPWHRRRTSELTVQAPRTPNFNMLATDHHPLLSTAPEFDAEAIKFLDLHMRDRWGTLFSIDDMLAEVAKAVDGLPEIASNTYIMYTSDHGYHLGQFRIPDEKMMPYETDIRVPFFARGPGIKPGTKIEQMVSNIDIGPTLCDLAGISVPNLMDGRSLVPLLKGSDLSTLDRPWRTHFMTEFAEGGTQQWGTNGMWSTDPANPVVDLKVNPPWGINCTNKNDCPQNPCGPSATSAETCPHESRFDYQYDDPSYNWRALRVMNETSDFTFVQWDPAYLFGKAPAPPAPSPPSPGPSPIKPAKMMPSTDIDGPDSPHPCPAVSYGNTPLSCEADCKAKAGCVGWTLHYNQPTGPEKQNPGWRCCTKTAVLSLRKATSNTTSGVLNPADNVHEGLRYDYEQFIEATQHLTIGGNITFSEFYDLKTDPWQMKNLWSTLGAGKQAALMTEIDKRFACTGTRTTPSNCE
jgi:arylsulfatase A-like enzyme